MINIEGESCIFDERGNPVQGLTEQASDMSKSFNAKRQVKVLDCAKGGEQIEFIVDAAANALWGAKERAKFGYADLGVFSRVAWDLFHDFTFVDDLMRTLPEGSRRRKLLLRALNDVANAIGDGDDSSLRQCRRILAPELKRRANDSALEVSAIGHAHIDVAWLWPLRETVRKCARTFSTALRMMEEYPAYRFGASQPHLYQMVKDNYPGLYKRIKKAVAAGKWELQGGMWVEADTNVPSGESLVRQVLHGKRFYQQEFGVDVNVGVLMICSRGG